MRWKNQARSRATKYFIGQWSRKNHRRNILDEVKKEEFEMFGEDTPNRYFKSKRRKTCKGDKPHDYQDSELKIGNKVWRIIKKCTKCGKQKWW